MTRRVLDARPSLDPRNALYPATVDPALVLRSYTWACPVVLDQGDDGACVGFSRTHELAAKPKPVAGLTNRAGFAFYERAQDVDEWPGSDYEGTSVLAGVKVAKSLGWYGSYRWAQTWADAARVVGYKGPVVLGIPWFTGMFDPDASGYLHPTGQVEGWHAILWPGINVTRKDITLHNSWGPGWGNNGRARMRWPEFQQVIGTDGADMSVVWDRTLTGTLP